jgi:hypothetical protein
MTNSLLSAQQALALRLAVGGLFGLAIGLMAPGAAAAAIDPARAMILSVLTLGAFVLWAGAGAMRRLSLAVWALCAFALIALMAWHAKAHLKPEILWWSPVSVLLIGPLLFIAHELVSSADQAGRIIAPYRLYFEEAWKRGVQLGLALAFTLLFWGILWLGATLLGFIGFSWLRHLLQDAAIAVPLTGLALGASVHLADVQPKLLGSVRAVILGVLSWLLPVITAVGALFAASLAASGLQPLWDTNAATITLLAACIGFVLLINAAYQDGPDEDAPHPVLSWSVRGASLLLLVFAVLAAWSLWLRIDQYGLTQERILAGAAVVIALAFGLGYAVAAVLPGRWMALLERVNVALAVLKVALFAALLTPLAPPERLAVNDQLARLERGVVDAATLDWRLLAEQTGSYGRMALQRLADSPDSTVAQAARRALEGDLPAPPAPVQKPEERPVLAAIPVVSPAGAALPDSFLASDFALPQARADMRPGCLLARQEPMQCKAALLDLTGDGEAEVLILEGPALFIFVQTPDGWRGQQAYLDAGGLSEAFASGDLSAQASPWRDVRIGARVLRPTGPPPEP